MSEQWAVLLAVLAVALLFVVAGACFKIADWHQQESDYWQRIHLLSLIDEEGTNAYYLPVLEWCQANRLSVWQRLRPWQDPEVRMGGAR